MWLWWIVSLLVVIATIIFSLYIFYSSYKVPPYYDSLIAKIITYGDTREHALARMRGALDETIVEGIKTNIPLHQDILRGTTFQRGGINIHYLEKWLNL